MHSSATDAEMVVGQHPDDLDTPVTLPLEALDAGCYLSSEDRHRRTALLQDWCVQWADAGLGFCYVHPRGPAPRSLLGRLPEDRLDDVVWLDFRRSRLPDQFEVPANRRVGLDPFDGPEDTIDPSGLVADPITARTTDFVAACTEHDDTVDWNVTRILTTVLPWLYEEAGPDHRGLSAALSSIHLDESVEPLLELHPNGGDRTARSHLEQALTIDPSAFVAASQCLGWPLDPFPSNPLIGETTDPLYRALTEARILLVTGALPPADAPPSQYEADRLGTHLLTLDVVQRLWEAAQTYPSTATFPLVLVGLAELVPEPGIRFREVLEHGTDTPLAPVASGPPREKLPEQVGRTVSEHVDTRIVQATSGSSGLRGTIQGGDLTAAERYLEREQAGDIGEGPLRWVRMETAGLLATDPRSTTQSRPAVPREPPTTRRDAAAVADAITRSVDQYGADPS